MTPRPMSKAEQERHERDKERIRRALLLLDACATPLHENEDMRVATARLENLLNENLGRWVV